MKSLTPCQASRTRVAMRSVKRVANGPAMEALTPCQANRTRVGVRTKKGSSQTWYEITHILSSQ